MVFMRLIECDQLGGGNLVAGGGAQQQPALEPGGGHADMPALPFFAEPVGNRHAHIVEEDFGEHQLAVHARDRPAGDTWRIERKQHERHAFVPFAARGAEQAERPIGKHRAA